MVGRHICTLPMTSHLSLEHTLVGLWLMRLVQTGMPSIAIVDLCDDANSNIFPSLLLTLTRGMHIPTETLIFHSPALGRRSHHIPAILHNGTGGRKVVSGVGLRGRTVCDCARVVLEVELRLALLPLEEGVGAGRLSGRCGEQEAGASAAQTPFGGGELCRASR